MSAHRPYQHAHRVIASLNRDQVDFLDCLGKDALFSSGTKLSRTEILSAMVNVFRQLQVTGDGVTSGDELESRILHAIQQLRSAKLHGGGGNHE